jgi:NAD(P)-dependent dehydrogenase (short-subunit alcohol dehydrogenase family)
MNMQGKICVVTGASNGIGKETARALARQGLHVVMVCRSRDRGEAVRSEILAEVPGAGVDLMICDLASQASVKEVAAEILAKYPAIHVLINNAAINTDHRQRSVDGVDLILATNHLGPFLLTHLLADALAAGAPSRVVNVSSMMQRGARIDWDDLEFERRAYSIAKPYAQSKLMNIMFTYELARRWKDRGVTVNAVHPGVIKTGLSADIRNPVVRVLFNIAKRFFNSPEEGAEGSVYLATSPEVERETGGYYEAKKLVKSNPISYDQEALDRLWRTSEKYLGLTWA